MMYFYRFSILLLTALMVAVLPLKAAWERSIGTSDGSGIIAQIESPFDTVPPDGFFPVRITIENRSGAERSWAFISSSYNSYSKNRVTLTSSETLKVSSGQTGIFDALLPISPTLSIQGQVQLTGYGMLDPVYLPGGSPSSGTVFVGMSKKISARSWGPLKEFLKTRELLRGTEVDLDLLGEDWRGLLGLRCLWISDVEYASLSSSRRLAIRDWLLQGGELVFCTQDLGSVPRLDFAVTGQGDSEFVGLGRVNFLKWDGLEFSSEVAAKLILDLEKTPPAHASGNDYDTHWELAQKVGGVTWNIPVLSLCIAIFALVVGPLNLFWFARSGYRHRLFWTTPLISVVASVLFSGLIVLQDGIGGMGARSMVVYIDPVAKRLVLLQEQISKTGVLVSSQFDAPEIDFLTPLPISGFGKQDRNETCEKSGSKYFGDWFSTRWRQGQFAESIRPTRAELRLTKSNVVDGTPPQILSSLPGTLQEVFVIDAEGSWWVARNVSAGRKVVLQPSTLSQFTERLKQFPVGLRLNKTLAQIRERENFFYAFADSGEFLPTLPSIRWRDNYALYVGPLAGPSSVTP